MTRATYEKGDRKTIYFCFLEPVRENKQLGMKHLDTLNQLIQEIHKDKKNVKRPN